MRAIHPINMLLWLIALFILPLLAFAHGGEEHNDETRAQVSAAPSSEANLELESPEVELSGTLQNGKLTLYADHYASNEPIYNAKIELESNGHKVQAQAMKDGSYTAATDWFTQPGKHEVVVSIETVNLEDLLIGTLDVPGSSLAVPGRTWMGYAKWAAVIVTALIIMVVALKFKRQHKRLAAAALPVFMVLLLSSHSMPVFAHGDEDHSDKSSPSATATVSMPATGTAPARLPDGSIFAPKPAQRLLGIRTVLAKSGDIAQAFEINGHVIANPNFSGRVQSSQSGRIAAPAGGFPTIGMKVNKGQILAYIEPVASSIDKGNQQAQLAELSSKMVLAENRARRLAQLEGSVPQKEIDAARAEAVSLKAQKTAISGSFTREALRSPVSGAVSLSNVIAGQVVEAKEILFEVIDPAMLRVEAIAYDGALPEQITNATGETASKQPLKLTFIGQSYQLREQALPMQFGVTQPAPVLNIGQPVKVFVQTRKTIHGTAVPQSSIVKNSSGESSVWIHTSAERFEQRKVKIQPLDTDATAIIDGLHDGDRVVTQGAALLSQIR